MSSLLDQVKDSLMRLQKRVQPVVSNAYKQSFVQPPKQIYKALNKANTVYQNGLQEDFNPFSKQFQARNQQFAAQARSLPNFSQPLEGIRKATPGAQMVFRQPLAPEPVNATQRSLRIAGAAVPSVIGGWSRGTSLLNTGYQLGTSALLGGAANKYFGNGSFGEGASAGAESLPMIQNIGSVTNPLISKYSGKFGNILPNPASRFLATHGLAGLGAIPEGAVMNAALGQGYTPGNAAIDFISGSAGSLLGPGEHLPSTGTTKSELMAGSKAKGFENASGKFASRLDKNVKFEISDRQASLKNWGKLKPGEATSLDNVLNHEGLFKQYPGFKNLTVSRERLPGGARGEFNQMKNHITIDSRLSRGEARSTILHEVQHAVQRTESWPLGTNSYDAGGFGNYLRNPGEIEARAVQTREAMSPEMRRSIDPYSATMDQNNIKLKEVGTKPITSLLSGSEPRISQSIDPGIGQQQLSMPGNLKGTVNPQGLNSSDINIPPQTLNVKRLGLNDAQKLEVQNLQIDDIKQKLSNKEITDLAERVGIDTKSHTIDQTANKIAEQLNQRRQVTTLEQQLTQMRSQNAPLSEIEKITTQIAKASKVATEQGTDIARQLQARRIIASEFDSPMQKVFKLLNNAGVNEEAYGKAAASVDFNNPTEVVKFFRSFVPPSASEWIDKLRYNSMLSSPNTSINNAASNFQGTGILTPIQKTIEGGIDATLSALTGRDRTRFAGEGLEYAKGYYGSLKSAYKNMLSVFKNDNAILEHPDLRSMPLTSGGAGKMVENALDLPSKSLEAMDQFFKTLTTEGLIKANEYKLAKGGKSLAPQAAEEANKLLFRGELTEPGQGVVSNFVGSGAEWVKRATQSKNATFRWLAKLTLPFVNTGTNLAKAGLEANPLVGAVNLIGNKDKTAQLAKMIMGGTVMTVGGMLAMDDKLTFGEPTGEKDKAMFRSAGMQPYSIKIGDKWVSYSKLHPLVGFQLGMVAALSDAYKKKKIGDDTAGVISQGLFDSLKFFADQTYFKNIGDFVNTVSGDVEGLSKLASNYPSQFIPYRGFASWINRIIDQYQRKPDTDASFVTKTFQQMATQIPGLSGMVPPRLGIDGQPIKSTDRVLNAFSPVRATTENPNNAEQYKLVEQAKKDAQVKTDTDTKTATDIVGKVNQATTREEKLGILQQAERDGIITPSIKTKIKGMLGKAKPQSSEASAIGSISSNYGKASYIVGKVKTMGSREEKLMYLQQLEAEGVITADLKGQIKQLFSSGGSE